MITYRNNLDICPGGVPLFIRLSQYDSNFTLIFDLFSHKGDFVIESGTTAKIRESKPDGNVISIDATLSGTTVTVAPSEEDAQQMTAVKGNCVCELTLYSGTRELNTANFILIVEKAAVDKDTVQSDSVVRELIEITDQAEEIIAAAERVTDAIDPTLTLEGHAADAKAVGDQIRVMEPMLWTPDIKTTLLECFRNVAWLNDDSSQIYEALRAALYANEYPKIIATYIPGTDPVYTDDSLVDLKQYISVKFYESASSAGVVIPSSDYSLSGTLVEGTSNLVVTYNQYNTLVAITDVIDYYNWSEVDYPNSSVMEMLDYGANPNTNAAPTRIILSPSDARRTLVFNHGKVPYYEHNIYTEPMEYYPIPVPSWATKWRVEMEPIGQYVFSHCVTLNGDTYSDSIEANRVTWTQLANGYLEKTLVNAGNMFAMFNFKYDSAGRSYPVEPSSISVKFLRG